MSDPRNPYLHLIREIKLAVRAARFAGIDEAEVRAHILQMTAPAPDVTGPGKAFLEQLVERALSDALAESF